MACRDRVKSAEGDMKLWSATVSECFNLKKTVLAVDAGKRDAMCTSAVKTIKLGRDCVRASYGAKKHFE